MRRYENDLKDDLILYSPLKKVYANKTFVGLSHIFKAEV